MPDNTEMKQNGLNASLGSNSDLLDGQHGVFYRDAGNLTNVEAILQRVYPVGTVHKSTNTANPATYFGIGTWSSLGANEWERTA